MTKNSDDQTNVLTSLPAAMTGRASPAKAAVGDKPGELLLVTPKKRSGRMGRAYAYVAETMPNGPARPDLEDAGMEVQPTPVVTLDGFCAERG